MVCLFGASRHGLAAPGVQSNVSSSAPWPFSTLTALQPFTISVAYTLPLCRSLSLELPLSMIGTVPSTYSGLKASRKPSHVLAVFSPNVSQRGLVSGFCLSPTPCQEQTIEGFFWVRLAIHGVQKIAHN